MNRPCITYGEDKTTKFYSMTLKGRDQSRDPDVDEKII
jgi:hypothetical protein